MLGGAWARQGGWAAKSSLAMGAERGKVGVCENLDRRELPAHADASRQRDSPPCHPRGGRRVLAAGRAQRRALLRHGRTAHAGGARGRRRRAALRDAGDVVGVFVDDAPDFHGNGHWASRVTYTLLEEALDRPADDAAHQAAVAFLRRNYASFEWFAGAWGLDIYGKFETLSG